MTQSCNKVLIITSSGGGGLIQAAIAKEQEIKQADPDAIIIKKDLMMEWTWKIFGWFGVNTWNWAQRHGSVFSQFGLAKFQKFAEYLLWPRVFFHAISTIFAEDVSRVIDTQPIGTSAIIKAIRLFNRFRKKEIVLEKVLVDLPTKASTHFFRSIKKLSCNDKECLRLITIKPLLEKGETDNCFWQKHCGLSNKIVQYESYYIRQSFKQFIGKKRPKEPMKILVRTENALEAAIMEKMFSKGSVHAEKHKEGYLFSIDPSDKLFVVLLGSQPSFYGTKGYVHAFIEAVKKYSQNNTKAHLFVFCSQYQANKHNLYHHLNEEIAQLQDYPTNFSIIPMSFQKDDVIAPLLFRSDISITRSGGQTSMEIMAVASGMSLIHSETKFRDKELSMKQLISGIPVWEAGNARYMLEKQKSKIVVPEMIPQLAKSVF